MNVKSSDIHPSLFPAYSRVASTSQVDLGCASLFLNTFVGTAILLFGGYQLIFNGWVGFWILVVGFVLQISVAISANQSIHVSKLDQFDLMQRWLPTLTYTAGGKSYVEAFLSIARTTTLEQHQATSMLRSLNNLMDDYIILDQQKTLLKNIIGKSSSSKNFREIMSLEYSLKTADPDDHLTITTARTNIDLLKSQMADLEALEKNMSRIESQQKLIINAMNTITLSLGRSQTATLVLNAPDIDQIAETTREITSQTKAVEMAVQEVMALKIQA